MQKNDAGERITGSAATFASLELLTHLRLDYTGLVGVLATGPRVRIISTTGAQHDTFQPGANALVLESVEMVDGSMTGPVPTNLLNAPALTRLVLRGNQFSSMSQQWAATALKVLDVSDNAIEVRPHASDTYTVRPPTTRCT